MNVIIDLFPLYPFYKKEKNGYLKKGNIKIRTWDITSRATKNKKIIQNT